MLGSFGPTPTESCGHRSHSLTNGPCMSSTILGPVGPRSPSVWCVTRTSDPPPGLIAVPVPKAVLLLTHAEYVRGVERGKWWTRIQAEATREADAVTPQTPRA